MMRAADRAGRDPRPGGPRLTTRRDAPGRGEAQAKTVLEPAEIRRALTRIAHEILERTNGGGGVGLLGIPTRGVALAPRLAQRLRQVEGRPGSGRNRDIHMYRHELRLRAARAPRPTQGPAGR